MGSQQLDQSENPTKIIKNLPPIPDWDDDTPLGNLNKHFPNQQQSSPNALRELDLLLEGAPTKDKQEVFIE
jgi:hypothetical protein